MYSVYGLIDPRDSTIRYIGLSKDAYKRLGVHLVKIGEDRNPRKASWLAELRTFNALPILKILETVTTRAEAEQRERDWIAQYLPYGFLTNISKMEDAIEVIWEETTGRVMDMETAKQFIARQGWTPQVKPRRNGVLYLYAARRVDKKTEWRYISPVSKLGKLTEGKILEQLDKIKTA